MHGQLRLHGTLTGNELVKVRSSDVFQYQVFCPPGNVGVHQLHNLWMAQAGQRTGLAAKALQPHIVALGVASLDGRHSPQGAVLSQKHTGGAAGTQRLDQLVLAEVEASPLRVLEHFQLPGRQQSLLLQIIASLRLLRLGPNSCSIRSIVRVSSSSLLRG